jgi:hypothetical protein
MKKSALCLLFAVSFSMLAYGQLEEKIKEEGVVSGIVYKNGEEIHGYFRKTGTTWSRDVIYPAPWEFQNGVKFIPKDVFEKTEKIRNKMYASIEAKDCDAFKYDTLMFESVRYADMSAVGMNMLPKRMFLNKVIDDKISVYYHYYSPPSVVTGEEGFAPYYIECGKPNVVYKIGEDGKLKLLNSLNIEKELEDCPTVVEKHANGEYKVLGGEGEARSGFNKLLNNAVFREDIRLQAIVDYNENCK